MTGGPRYGHLAAAAAALADGAGAPAEVIDQLTALCRSARLAHGAASVSVARIVEGADGGGLRYEAAEGRGADGIVGVLLPAGRGIAGYVAATGQALAVDRVQDDPRFARDVAESTGYLPTTMLVVPITGPSGDPIGVLSVLDRGGTAADVDVLVLASSFAQHAGTLLPSVDLVARLGPMLLGALAEALDAVDDEHGSVIATSLRSAAGALSDDDAGLARTAAMLLELQTRPAATRSAVERVLAELLSLTEARRRR